MRSFTNSLYFNFRCVFFSAILQIMPIIFRTSKIGIEQDVRNIPENYTALLMHYFDCVCTVLDLGFIQYNLQKIRSYTNYYNLTDGEKKTLFMLCGLFSVDVLKDKCIIENGEICGRRRR
jgi:hypothetical protein